MFPVSLRYQLITIPCCEGCNNGHSETDELLLLLSGCAFNQMDSSEIDDKIIRSFSAEKSTLRKHWPSIYKSRTIDENGLEWMKWPPHMRETIPRMVKGLLYRYYGVRDFSQDHFSTCVMSAGMRDVLLSEASTGSIRRIERGGGVFRADIVIEPDVKNIALFWLQFFKGLTYYVLYVSENPLDAANGL